MKNFEISGEIDSRLLSDAIPGNVLLVKVGLGLKQMGLAELAVKIVGKPSSTAFKVFGEFESYWHKSTLSDAVDTLSYHFFTHEILSRSTMCI